MKTRCLLLAVFIATGATAQEGSEPRSPDYPSRYPPRNLDRDLLTEKLYVTVTTPGDPCPFLLNTATADLWKLSPGQPGWVYLGDPRGAHRGRKGQFQLIPFQTGKVLILDTSSGQAWLADGSSIIRIDDPSSRSLRHKGGRRTWDELWEEFKKAAE